MSNTNNSSVSNPIKSRRTSSTASNESTLSNHEIEYMALRDEHLSYEDDAEFHNFIDALDRVDSLVTEQAQALRRGRKESISRVFNGLNNKLRRQSTLGSTTELE
ncbi:Ff.00g025080.m01.CDS01 [Fusarium sp. VM40]|nr:Ff.00g025080.m01.CDS01 [Fusarium sp. VM40]